MKRTVFAALAAVLALSLASCVSSWSDGGYLVIGFGGSARSFSTWPPTDAEVARMVINVTLDGPGGARELVVQGGTSITVPLEPGRWRIDSRVVMDGDLCAVGDTEYLQVKQGRNNVNVTLRRPPALSLDASGTHTFPAVAAGYAPASAYTVTVSNGGSATSGDLSVSLSGTGASAFVLSRTSLPGIPGRAGASFTVRPKPGQGVGTYAGTVTVSGEGLSASFDVGFQVFLLGTVMDADNPDLMKKFGVSGTDAAAVTAAFTAIRAYLAGINAADLVDAASPIRLGDYIDLPSLSVAAYSGNGTPDGAFSITNPAAQTNTEILRIIVAGRNSFNGINGNGTAPHLVFQFLNVPGTRRMEATNTNANGYLGSEMREYLVGPYLAGLAAAGVPGALLWAPTRLVAEKGQGAAGTHTITDKLWLPTERELCESNSNSNGTHENSGNQARLEYYTSGELRKKYSANNTASASTYWTASPYPGTAGAFCCIGPPYGNTYYMTASQIAGIAPAFCVTP